MRDGFLLAVKLNGGKLGGLPAEVIVGDDQLKPDVGRQLVERYIKRDHVDLITGIVFSNVLLAVCPRSSSREHVLSSAPTPAPTTIAGKNCNPYFFAVPLAERGTSPRPRASA